MAESLSEVDLGPLGPIRSGSCGGLNWHQHPPRPFRQIVYPPHLNPYFKRTNTRNINCHKGHSFVYSRLPSGIVRSLPLDERSAAINVRWRANDSTTGPGSSSDSTAGPRLQRATRLGKTLTWRRRRRKLPALPSPGDLGVVERRSLSYQSAGIRPNHLAHCQHIDRDSDHSPQNYSGPGC